MGKSWFVARTLPGQARIAEAELGRPYGGRPAFATLLPLTSAGHLIFGPYIFIEFDLEADPWPMINGVRGVMRLLPMGSPTPLPIRGDFTADLARRLGRGDFDDRAAAELAHAYGVGEEALVTSGPWEGHRGKFVRRQKGFINLTLVLFQREFEVPVPAHQVRPASPKAA